MRSVIGACVLRLAAAVLVAGLVSAPCTVRAESGAVLEILLSDGAGKDARHIALDIDALHALPRSAFRTATIWTAGRERFEGVRLHDLLTHLGVAGGDMLLIGQNGYQAEFPVDEVRPDGALLAFARNGVPMTTRDKGPLWLVFPYDDDARFRTELHYARSVWQLDRIEIER